MRAPGAHLAVCEDGSFDGSLSGGCIENAVVSEAMDTLKAGKPRITRFGDGSPYIDIKLPCGGGLDIHFQPLSDAALVEGCLQHERSRRPFALGLPLGPGEASLLPTWRATQIDREGDQAIIGHIPPPRLVIIGHGATVESLAKLAETMDTDVEVHTPDTRVISSLSAQDIACHLLKTPGDVDGIHGDAWSSFIFLFHDHDWETDLMAHALQQPHCYIGAMGGRQAHALRQSRLSKAGVPQAQIDSICAPIGLFHSARDPDTLALSTLAEAVRAYQEADFSGAQ